MSRFYTGVPLLMPLSEQQRRAIEVFDWYFDMSEETRMTGRTHVTAIALIRQAARRPGIWVALEVDHLATAHCLDYLRYRVVDLVNADPLLAPHMRISRTSGLQLDLPHSIPNWLPEHLRPSQDPPEPPRVSFWERLRQT